MVGRNGNAVRRMVGKKFGELVVVRQAPTGERGYLRWECKCSCGQMIEVDGDRLRAGQRTACGVANHYLNKPSAKYSREDWKTEYVAWANMKQRCNSSKHKRYKDYGGRGITVCERWKKFENFADDMGPKPSPIHSLDRKDANGNYEPENCKWSTPTEQARNRRRTVFVEHEGRRQKMADLIATAKVPSCTVWHRVKWGWPIDEALNIPKGGRPTKRVATPMFLLEIAGEEKQ